MNICLKVQYNERFEPYARCYTSFTTMSVLENAIGWLAPPSCVGCGDEGIAFCEMCQAAELLPHGGHCGFCGALSPDAKTCARCRRSGAPRHIFISTDYEGAAQRLLNRYKFRHQRAAVLPIARIMGDTLNYFLGENLNKQKYLIVPVPSATSRVRLRSFDHAKLLAKQLASQTGQDYYPALSRLGQTRQVGAKRSQRLAQQTGNYYASRPDKISGRKILIIDDVLTTGSTMRAIYKTLRQAGAKQVDALVFAKKL